MSDSPDIKVSDRRRFSSEGEPLPEEAASAAESARTESPQADLREEEAPAEPPPATSAAQIPRSGAAPPANFQILVVSLSMQAEMALGLGEENANPELDLARHMIDLLGVLKEKTQGNLSLEEQRLLENSLTELRFRFVQAQQAAGKAQA